ncbi:MAG: AsmA family protein, partial [Desulfobacteraceae bacterium]
MKRAVKWTLIGVGGLIVLVIIVLLAAPMFIELDRHKPMIEETVTEATGRPFRLAGELDLSLFPWAGISLSRIHLGNPEGFEKEDMLYVESFEVRLKLLPLIF